MGALSPMKPSVLPQKGIKSMQAPSLEKLLSVAVEAARTGGLHAQSNFSRCSEVVQSYAHDVKLALDVECQTHVEAVIHKYFPEHAILGEEDETSVNGTKLSDSKPTASESGGYEWIIDPIDGTVNFSHGFPSWCCSVAVRQGETVLAGAVFAPDHDALYTASVDAPAKRNGIAIHVSTRKTLAESLVMTGMDKNLVPGVAPLAYFSRIAQASQKARIMGSAALDLCLVAEGKADGYFEGSIYIWDIAAAGLIVKQAGGSAEIIALREEPYQMSYVATNGHIQDTLKQLVALPEA
jgi:myo-inositol-1(or 4)-monophosphatase